MLFDHLVNFEVFVINFFNGLRSVWPLYWMISIFWHRGLLCILYLQISVFKGRRFYRCHRRMHLWPILHRLLNGWLFFYISSRLNLFLVLFFLLYSLSLDFIRLFVSVNAIWMNEFGLQSLRLTYFLVQFINPIDL